MIRDVRFLDFDGDLSPILCDRAVDLCDGGGGNWLHVELGEYFAGVDAELTLEDGYCLFLADRRCMVLGMMQSTR